jgi:hypothetical protein
MDFFKLNLKILMLDIKLKLKGSQLHFVVFSASKMQLQPLSEGYCHISPYAQHRS